MARRVFFTFHYDRDIWRTNPVRNSWVTKPDREEAGFWDASLWEEAEKKGDLALKRLINGGLQGTSVTAILSGKETYARRWVKYEIAKSFMKGNGILTIYIHQVKSKNRTADSKGTNPLLHLAYRVIDESVSLLEWNGNEWVDYTEVSSEPLGKVPYVFPKNVGQLSTLFPEYDWIDDNGYHNFAAWVEKAARHAGR